jgi:preprotein translocase subunit SecG
MWILGGIMITLMAILFLLVSLILILAILVQRPRGGGLAGAFGGAGGMAQTAFGAKIGDFLTWASIILFALFLLLAMGLTWATKPAAKAPKGATPVETPAQTPGPTTQP